MCKILLNGFQNVLSWTYYALIDTWKHYQIAWNINKCEAWEVEIVMCENDEITVSCACADSVLTR